MDRPTSTIRPMNTWAVAPSDTLPPVPPLPSRRIQGRTGSRRSSLDEESDSSETSSEGTFRPTPRTGQDTSRRITYKPSFVKSTFQWMKGDEIGSGSYGRVFMALNATTGDLMAVKQVEIPKTSSDKLKEQQMETMKALRFEGETLKDLNHPNVVSYLGFEESQNYLSIFLEYVAGGTVGSLLRDHWPLREDVVKTWLGQILAGLDYLHERGIIHRDLKSDNILVDYSGTCKISDFGISKKASEMTRVGKAYTTLKGTIYWMAPEVLASTADGYDVKVDIWSVGCVAVEMWTGKRPWHPLPFPTVMLEVGGRRAPPPIPETITISPLAENFRQQCFHGDPALRPHSAELKEHPYILDVRPGCTIQLDDIADKPLRFQPGLFAPPLRESRSVVSLRTGYRPDPTARPSKPPLPNLTIPSWNQPLPPPQQPTGRQSAQGAVTESPPLVTITPLASSGQRSARTEEPSAMSATSTDTPKSRRLVISNPDNEPQPQPTFIFTPPPLPEPPRRSATSSSRPLPSFPPVASSSKAGPSSASASSSSFQAKQFSRRPSGDASSSGIRSPPRPLPPSPASIPPVPQSPPPPHPRRSSQHTSRRPGSSRDRSQTLTAIDISSLKLYEEGNPAAKSVYNLSAASSSTTLTSSPARNVTGKRLPISPQPISTSVSSSTLGSIMPPPSSSPRLNKRMVSRQKSVPDVSIFSYDPTNARSQRGLLPRQSYDSDDYSDTDGGSPRSVSYGASSPKRRDSMRPRTEDIYESLEQFFPNRDLDQPVDTADPITPRPWDTFDSSTTLRRDASVRKSIRAIAREQHRLSYVGGKSGSNRRQTMLWNSHMQELK
ncbi:STE/STE11 protein kinase [Coprinopsis sp. MPI-PUGE-AT-0042]|nr:STE/STE11 protein kinase [Coprinopsis sp. MPI-PUGE-AT-0042]